MGQSESNRFKTSIITLRKHQFRCKTNAALLQAQAEIAKEDGQELLLSGDPKDIQKAKQLCIQYKTKIRLAENWEIQDQNLDVLINELQTIKQISEQNEVFKTISSTIGKINKTNSPEDVSNIIEKLTTDMETFSIQSNMHQSMLNQIPAYANITESKDTDDEFKKWMDNAGLKNIESVPIAPPTSKKTPTAPIEDESDLPDVPRNKIQLSL